MKKTFKYLCFTAVAFVTSVMGVSCGMDTPFDESSSGNGSLHLSTDIKGNTVTRADIDAATMASLREKAIVYIERKSASADRHDVIRKYNGLETIPGEISLAKGNTYLAEGWTGDSVSASFNAKFYRGKTDEFKVEDQTVVTLKLNIANVLVSFAPETFNLGLSDIKMTVGHSHGELIFSEGAEGGSTLHKTGYFMMPSSDNSLTYKLSAKTATGEVVSREGVIENVQRAHEYQVRLQTDEAPHLGAGLIKIVIDDIPVIEEEALIFGKPLIEGVEFDLADQVVGTPGEFTEKIVSVSGYDLLSSVAITGDDAPESIRSLSNPDVTNNTQAQTAEFENIGIHIGHEYKTEESTGIKYDTYTLQFKPEFFNALPPSSKEYVVEIYAVDKSGKYSYATLRIANTDAAIEVKAPVEAVAVPDANKSPMAITGSSATLTGYLYDTSVQDYGIEYRESGASDWTKVSAKGKNSLRRKVSSGSSRADKVAFSVNLTGLKPSTTYEYRSYCDGYEGSSVLTFSTESPFEIPNASFESWSSYSASTLLGTKSVVLPGGEGNKDLSFWGSGNEGAATANLVLTNKNTDIKHTGSASARLESKTAMGMLAAGNVFVGSYVKTDGTNGVLSLGRSYNGSHPNMLRVWANYRPGTVGSVKDENAEFLPANFKGGQDHGQVYVALTTEPVEIRTNPSNRKLFDPEDPVVLAYGEKTLTSKFGPDGELAALEVPITYNERAKTQRPMYLVIVVSASKYGDYFSGAAGSVFYLDDFELVY